MIVQLTAPTEEYPDLSTSLPYCVIGIEAGDLRILNDQGRPYLYPASLFTVIDDTEPADWITEFGEEGERYAYPKILNAAGFFEDYFDGDSKAIAVFWQTMNQRLSQAA
jgi:hypothetical protein